MSKNKYIGYDWKDAQFHSVYNKFASFAIRLFVCGGAIIAIATLWSAVTNY